MWGIFLLGIAEMLGSDWGEDIVNKMKIKKKKEHIKMALNLALLIQIYRPIALV